MNTTNIMGKRFDPEEVRAEEQKFLELLIEYSDVLPADVQEALERVVGMRHRERKSA